MPPETIARLRAIPLPELLRWHGFTLRPEGASFRAKNDHHNIVVSGGRWFDNKTAKGSAGAIDLQMHLTGQDFFPACHTLAEEFQPGVLMRIETPFPDSEPGLAEASRQAYEDLAAKYARHCDEHWPIVRDYLVRQRRLDIALIDQLHDAGSIYANDHRPGPSAVFLHRDADGAIRGATLRSTHSASFRPTLGDKLTAWFLVGDWKSAREAVITESPIEALSYKTLFPDPTTVAVSVTGNYVPEPLLRHIQGSVGQVVFALNPDVAGIEGTAKAMRQWSQLAGGTPRLHFPQMGEDWNDFLVKAPNLSKGVSLKW